jgi:hypothetical protein
VRASLLAIALAACAAAPPPVRYSGAGTAIRADVEAGRRRVEAFFGAPFPRPFTVEVLPDRRAFTARLREELKDPTFESACWMVGVGSGAGLALLAPERWAQEACEHDAADARHVRNLVAHELVHVYHAQVNPLLDREPDRFEPLGWFVEGLAVLVSGQLDDGHLAPAAEAVRLHLDPPTLAKAWSGKYRYGVSGSLVAWVDRRAGRGALVRMLRAASQDELLAAVGLGEAELLRAWLEDVRASSAAQ